MTTLDQMVLEACEMIYNNIGAGLIQRRITLKYKIKTMHYKEVTKDPRYKEAMNHSLKVRRKIIDKFGNQERT